MFCPKCGTESTTNFCPNCGQQLNQQNTGFSNNTNSQYNAQPNYNNPQYYNPYPIKKKTSVVGIIAFVLSFFGLVGVIGALIGILDLIKDKNKEYKHGFSVAAIVIGFLVFLVTVNNSSGNTNNTQSQVTDTNLVTESASSVDTASENVKVEAEQVVEYNRSLEEVLSEFESLGDATVSLNADVLYSYGGYYSGWIAHTAFVVDESYNNTLKCNTDNNDSYFYSLVCYFDEDIVVDEGESVELVGVVATPSSFGSTVSLEHCCIVSTGDRAKEEINSLINESDQQVADAEMIKEAAEQAAEEAAIQDKEDYKNSCETVNYSDVERNPDSYKDKDIVITGKVIQVSEGWFDSVTLRIEASGGNTWYVTYYREEGESRILENDQVTVYGVCTGVTTYTSILGNSVTIPSMTAKIIELK